MGVPQGSVLSLLLFSLFLNNLLWDLQDLDLYLYADDIATVRGHKSPSTLYTQLQEDFSSFWHWLHTNKLVVNTQKCSVMIFYMPQRIKRLMNYSTILDPLGSTVPIVTEQKYLGILLGPHLSFNKHVQTITPTVLNQLKAAYKLSNPLGPEARKTLAINVFIPITEYALPLIACNSANTTLLPKPQNHIFRFSSLSSSTEHHCHS